MKIPHFSGPMKLLTAIAGVGVAAALLYGSSGDGTGVALIAIDGGPARAYRVGAAAGGEFILLGVSPGGTILGSPMGHR